MVFRRCEHCTSLFISSPYDSDGVAGLYGDDRYFQNPRFGDPAAGGYHGYRDYFADRAQIEAKFDQVLAHLEQWVAPGTLVDVGAGPGFLLTAAVARGWKALGIDVNPWAATHAREELGLEVLTGTLEDASIEPESVSAVTMMDLIEHLPSPEETLAAAARITRPNGGLAILTPDAGSVVSRLLGPRWPELQRAPEHLVLYSVRGLATVLERNGYEVLGWHPIGKVSTVATLVADIGPLAPRLFDRLQSLAGRRGIGGRRVALEPRTKFCIYARRTESVRPPAPVMRDRRLPRRPRVPKRPQPRTTVDENIHEDLARLARARRLCDWMFDQFADAVAGRVVEIGAGIGTFTERILAQDVEEVVLIEPEASCATTLRDRFALEPRVRIACEGLPESEVLAGSPWTFDFILCQNVLEHVDDHASAVAAMASSLRVGGQLTLLVPAHPQLFGTLDHTYGHHRRYTRQLLTDVVEGAGLEVLDLYSFNALGIMGWWTKNRSAPARIGTASLRLYDAVLPVWRPLESRLTLPWGLSYILHAQR